MFVWCTGNNNENLLPNENKNYKGDKDAIATTKETKPSLASTLLSVTCILHLYWIFIHVLRFVTFIGFLNQWIEELVDDGGHEESSKEEKGDFFC